MIELAAILVLGVTAQWIAWRLKIPAIFPLILIGLFAGPLSSYFTADGSKYIDPNNIFAGKTMYYFVSLAVGIILFEGGLTMKFKEVRHVAVTVRNILLIGTVIMLFGGALSAYYILGMDYRLALLFGALVIVTGPTVIAPILSSVKPNKNISTILKWESILIDPVGALVAVLVFELFFVATMGSHDSGGAFGIVALKTFLLTISVGATFGLFCGWMLNLLLRQHLIPPFLINIIALGFVVFAFAGSDALQSESGLLSVTIMGIFLANVSTPNIDKILDFKEDLTVLLISMLFIILASKIDLKELLLLDIKTLYVFLIVAFVLRPIVVFLSAYKSNLSFKEKIFISWIGPKGIVAAAVASLLSLYLLDPERITLPDYLREQVNLLIPLTFMIILGTVTLAGLTAKPLAKLLDIVKKESNGILIIGANETSIIIAEYLQSINIPVILVDTSHRNILQARMRGIKAIEENVLSDEINDEIRLEDVGQLMALTPSNDINIFACRKFRKDFGADKTFRLITVNEMKLSTLTKPQNILFGTDTDFIKLIEHTRNFPKIRSLTLTSQKQLDDLIYDEENRVIPLFMNNSENQIRIITANQKIVHQLNDILVYIGPEPELLSKNKASLENG